MGGPAYCDYLFPDGVLLQGLGASALFSADGRYFVAPIPSRERWGLLVLDRPAKAARRLEIDCFWELDSFTEQLHGRCSPLGENAAYRLDLRALLARVPAMPLRPFGDLWLEAESPAHLPSAKEFPLPAALATKHSLRGEPWLPDSLRALDDPLQVLRRPALRIWLDGEDTGLLLDEGESPVWNATASALACRARRGNQAEEHYWLWRAAEGWQALPEPWSALAGEPGLLVGAPLALEDETLLIDAQLALGELERLRFGYRQAEVHGPVDVIAGHDPRGRALCAERRPQSVQLVLPWAAAAGRGNSRVRLPGMVRRLELHWLRDAADGSQGAFACVLDGERLAGEWLLDVRASTCGGYLAMLAYAEAPAAVGEVGLLELASGRLQRLPLNAPVARLLDLRDGCLSVSLLEGQLAEGLESTPLRRFDRQAPAPARAAAFAQAPARAFYREARLAADAQGVQRLPSARWVTQPQVANAEGDFIFPAPSGKDRAWFFGAETEHRNGTPQAEWPRTGGCLLTASGCALADLTPAMIWSADGRYLLLTRQVERDDWHDLGPRGAQWLPMLLDTQAHRLLGPGPALSCRPLFEHFDESGVRVQIHATDWEVPGEQGVVREMTLAEMLGWPVVDLVQVGRLWLPADELQRAGQWRALDTENLMCGSLA